MKTLIAAFFVIAFMFAALSIETWRNSRKGQPGLDDRASAFLMLVVAALVLLFAVLLSHGAHARDLGQWQDGEVTTWYRKLMQPDHPTVPCCGEADAYWCDIIHVRDKRTFCTITDDRPDEPRGRNHIPLGTEIEIPNEKLKFDEGNPTGHAVLFAKAYLSGGYLVFCFVQGTGI